MRKKSVVGNLVFLNSFNLASDDTSSRALSMRADRTCTLNKSGASDYSALSILSPSCNRPHSDCVLHNITFRTNTPHPSSTSNNYL